jgi:transcriptional regulator with XRE-family HTH domain
MAAPHLQLDPDDCSGIGLLVLNYIEKHGLTFTEMAERVEISRAALRIVCLKEGNPGKKTIPKLAAVLNVTENELCRMICENKLRQMYEDDDESVNSTLEAIDSLVEMLHEQYKTLSEQREPQEYDIYQHAFKSLTRLPG